MKNIYQKIAPIVAKISMILFVILGLVWASASVVKNLAEDVWVVYYASLAALFTGIPTIVVGVVHLIFNGELVRKGIVALKRNPAVIPLLMMFVSFLLFSLSLTDVSNATAKVQGKGMGLCQFAIMLFSLLCMVCMLNAFPRRKKANIPMVVLMFVMFGILIYADVHYRNVIFAAWTRTENPIVIDETTMYIKDAFDMMGNHMVMIIVTAALVVLLPLYSKLIRMIKTSIEVEGNDEMGAIEINEE